METYKKKGILLAAVILGICGLVVWVAIGCFPWDKAVYGESIGLFQITIKIALGELGRDVGIVKLGLYNMFATISLLAALVLNILGWLKSGAKKSLIAAILYIISLSIPSAILCFIGFARLKK